MATSLSFADIGAFTGVPQHENFARMKDTFRTSQMRASSAPAPLERSLGLDLPGSVDIEGTEVAVPEFLATTDTVALLVLQDGVVRHESYALTGGADVPWISFSVAKSFVSALFGIAVADGAIRSIDDAVSDYIRVEPGSAYDGVPLRHVLQMSSGARWVEDYSDPQSDANRLGAAVWGDSTLDAFVGGMAREHEPGTICRYNSADTQALGAVVIAATGRSLSDYMQERLMEPLGMVGPGYWLTDGAGTEAAFAGLLLLPEDFARIGELYRRDGDWGGTQVVPEEWVRASVSTGGLPHLQPGSTVVGDHTLPLGYGYQWWLPDGDLGEFSAIGVYNQFVYTDPSRDVVIVKLSANRSYGISEDERDNHDIGNIALLRAVAAACD